MALPYHAHALGAVPFTEELRAGRVLDLSADERLIRIQVDQAGDEPRSLVDLIAIIPAGSFSSSFSQEGANGPLDVKVTILR